MDLFGEALFGYANGDQSPFYLIDEKGKKFDDNLAKRFRPYSRLNKTEKKLISLSRGYILDVGCGTGNFIPALEKRGKVVGVDVSSKVIEVARQRGCNSCIVADIFKYAPKQKFDTITFFGNDLGVGGTLAETRKLFQILKRLLKDDGQILAITRNYSHGEYKEMILTPSWKKKIGQKFRWLIFNINFLSEFCNNQNFNIQIVSTNWKYSLVKITKR